MMFASGTVRKEFVRCSMELIGSTLTLQLQIRVLVAVSVYQLLWMVCGMIIHTVWVYREYFHTVCRAVLNFLHMFQVTILFLT